MIEIVNRRANLSIRGVSDTVKIYEEEEEEEEEEDKEEIGARCTQAGRFPAASWVYYAAPGGALRPGIRSGPWLWLGEYLDQKGGHAEGNPPD